MEQYRRPNPHILEYCQNKEGENIGLANPENDQILVVRRKVLDRKFVYLSKHFDQIVNINGKYLQEERQLKFAQFRDTDLFRLVLHEVLHHIGWIIAQQFFGENTKNFSKHVELIVGSLDYAISNKPQNLYSDYKIDNLYYFIFQDAIGEMFKKQLPDNFYTEITNITQTCTQKYNNKEDIIVNYSNILKNFPKFDKKIIIQAIEDLILKITQDEESPYFNFKKYKDIMLPDVADCLSILDDVAAKHIFSMIKSDNFYAPLEMKEKYKDKIQFYLLPKEPKVMDKIDFSSYERNLSPKAFIGRACTWNKLKVKTRFVI